MRNSQCKVDDVTLASFMGTDGIWSRIRGHGLNPIPDTDYISPAIVDAILINRFGSRVMRELFINGEKDVIANTIVATFYSKWSDLMTLNTIVGAGEAIAGPVTTRTEKGNTKDSNTHDLDNRNKTVAYDSDQMVDENGNTIAETENKQGSHDVVETKQVVAIDTAIQNLQLKASYSIIDVVTADIADYLTLKIY